MFVDSKLEMDLRLFNLKHSFSEADLKSAYRKLAIKYHPDQNSNGDTSDDDIRRVYDTYERLKEYTVVPSVKMEVSLSEQLEKKWALEEEDIFNLYDTCPECDGARVVQKTITVEDECSNCKGSGFVKLPCKFCEDGLFLQRNKRKVPCRVCEGTGIWREVRCNVCSPFGSRDRNRSFFDRIFSSFFGRVYTEKVVEAICSKCKGRGKIKLDLFNPVIPKGAVLGLKKKLKKGGI